MVVVKFKKLPHLGHPRVKEEEGDGGGQEEEVTLQLELDSDADHAAITSALAARIGLGDPSRLRLTPVPLSFSQHNSLPILLGTRMHRNLLYYEILAKPFPASSAAAPAQTSLQAPAPIPAAAGPDSAPASLPSGPATAATSQGSLLDRLLGALAADGKAVGPFLARLASEGQDELLGTLLARCAMGSPSGQLEASQDLGDAIFAAVKGRRMASLGLLLRYASSSIPFAKGGIHGTSRSVLGVAARLGFVDCIRALLQYDPEGQVLAVDVDGLIPLLLACDNNRHECARLLLQHEPGKQLEAADSLGYNALMLSTSKGYHQCTALLLEHGPEGQVAAASIQGSTPLMLAVWGDHHQCAELLLKHKSNMQVQAVSSSGSTALMIAAERGHLRCVDLLLQHSPNSQVAALNRKGLGALPFAAAKGHSQCVSALLAHSPHLQHLRSTLSRTARRYIDSASNPQLQLSMRTCMQLLLAKGARLPKDAPKAEREVVWPIIQDAMAQALVPSHANEAVVGLAHEVERESRKRQREEEPEN